MGLVGLPDAVTMLSHNDLTVGDSSVAKHMLSVGIFRKTSFDRKTSFLNKTSASSMIPTKSLHGVTRPSLVPVDIKLFNSFEDFMFCSNICSSSFLCPLWARLSFVPLNQF